MTKERIQFINYLKLANYAENSIRIYVRAVSKLVKFVNKKPNEITCFEIREYFDFLIRENKSDLARASAYFAIKKYYHSVGLKKRMRHVPMPKRKSKVPLVLNKSEVEKILSASKDPFEKLVTGFLYSTGIRIGELANLRLKDIDFERESLYICSPKNERPRYVKLEKNLKELLHAYTSIYMPEDFLFYPLKNKNKPISTRNLQSRIRKIVLRSDLRKKVSAHTLRHCFATHLLEDGYNLFYIQKLLGHSSLSSTTIYLHAASNFHEHIKSPLRKLDPENMKPFHSQNERGLSFSY